MRVDRKRLQVFGVVDVDDRLNQVVGSNRSLDFGLRSIVTKVRLVSVVGVVENIVEGLVGKRKQRDRVGTSSQRLKGRI